MDPLRVVALSHDPHRLINVAPILGKSKLFHRPIRGYVYSEQPLRRLQEIIDLALLTEGERSTNEVHNESGPHLTHE